MNNKKELKFPKGFLWGASTSAYQIEGGIVCDWSEWEQKNADRLVRKAKTYWSAKQQAMFPEMFNRENYICGQAMDSYNRFDEDLACIKELNSNAYRMGIDWARIEPKEGEFNAEAIKHYRAVLQKLKDNNIKVNLTLWHWTMPLWVYNQGGWMSEKTITDFVRYSETIIRELGDLVDSWITFNEPMMHIGHGYLDGKFPPNKRWSILNIFLVFKNLIKTHKMVYQIIHNKFSQAQVSIAMTTGFPEPAHKWNLIEVLMARAAYYLRNEWFLNRVKNFIDYIGVNYYHHDRIIWYPPFKKNLNKEIDDRGWELYPQGIYYILKGYKKYQKPILILENGTADAEDRIRSRYIKEHLRYIHRAISEGVDVRGYFYWSLTDNFEWAEGYWPKFGLYAVDREHDFKRIARPSAKVYGEICKNGILKIIK
ncbi:MAG: glycoside hydrolase family 1 protein [Patescibacteria group bacterium]|nr:glycoside hydrolase family 1 protein [Patescibacteria group bacterium]MDD4610917.1 glycoside hydrolase family 1 protein [Patescibacteria group bacterium]